MKLPPTREEKLVRVANSSCSTLVHDRKEFKGNNLFAKWIDTQTYVVYSFGEHWPMIANIEGRWYFNVSKASCTTSKHLTQARRGLLGQEVSIEKMLALLAARNAVEVD